MKTIYSTLALFAISCTTVETPEVEAEHDHGATDYIHVTAEQRKLAEITEGIATPVAMPTYLEVNGMADVPPESLADISAPLGGFVKSAPFYEGAHVKKGQVLITLEHPEYIRMQQEFLDTRSQLQFLEQDIKRQEALLKGEAASQKAYQQRLAEYNSMKAQNEGLEASLRIAGLNPKSIAEKGIQQRISLVAPFDGIITRVGVNLGKQVGPEEILYQLYDPSHMHVELQVYPKDLSKIEVGQPIEYSIQGTSNWYPGKIVLIGGAVNMETRTIRIHAHPDHEDKGLKPGAFIQAKIATSSDTLMALPISAVLQEGGKSYVFAVREDGFERIEVKEKRRTLTHVALENYPAGPLVTSGAYYLIQVEESEHSH